MLNVSGQFVRKNGKPVFRAETKDKTFEYHDVSEFGFVKKLSFWMILKERIFDTSMPRGVRNLGKYAYFKRKITIEVKPDYGFLYLTIQPQPQGKAMAFPILRDFFNTHGYGCSQCALSYGEGLPVKIREGKWKPITEEQAQTLYESQTALLTTRIEETKLPNGKRSTIYHFGSGY